MTEKKPTKRALILSIKGMHADRIFQGTKRFELRKRLPQHPFDRVYLYQSGGGGIVGCFEPQNIVSMPVDRLWEFAGEDGAPRERFFQYFDGRLIGFAIQIKNPIKFSRPILPKELQRRVPEFTAPMSFLTLSEDETLYKILARKTKEESRQRSVTLVPITRARKRKYVELVTKVISAKYDEITPQFAKAALRSHSRGKDDHGIFTVRKEVLEVRQGSLLVGFTTLTFKFGNSVKTGPTILLEKFRKRGFGQATRAAIEKLVAARGFRKLYCTCPDNDPQVLKYLVEAGYRVEAHLRSHYRVENGEFVLGRVLAQTEGGGVQRVRTKQPGKVVTENAQIEDTKMAAAVHDVLNFGEFPITEEISSAIVRNSRKSSDASYEEKPLRIISLVRGDDVIAIAVCVPKRGGAVKMVIASKTSHLGSLDSLVARVEEDARNAARRKVFALFPLCEVTIADVLRNRGYEVEGVLREPYKPNIDCLVVSKFV